MTFIPSEVGIFALFAVYMLGTTLLLVTVGFDITRHPKLDFIHLLDKKGKAG